MIRATYPAVGVDSVDGYYVGLSYSSGALSIGREQYNWTLLGTSPQIPGGGVILSNWYHVTVRVVGCSITATAQRFGVAEQADVSVTDCTLTSGAIGIRTFDAKASWAVVTATTG